MSALSATVRSVPMRRAQRRTVGCRSGIDHEDDLVVMRPGLALAVPEDVRAVLARPASEGRGPAVPASVDWG
jgi:hypothetical protein